MADTHETGAEVIAEYRADADKMDSHELPQPTTQYLRVMLDRFDAAHKRERGDCAKLREALKLCMDEMCNRCRDLASARGNPLPCLQGCEPVRKARAALAAPPRNCDVGTAEEQAERWYWRYHVGHLCQSCPLGPRKWSEVDAGTLCFSEWQQMPYDEGGAK